jgi:ribose-phosphate pyrophosphokinase
MLIEEAPIVITGNESDNPFAIDIALSCGQMTDISDVLSMKTFTNTEFCPRFIIDEHDTQHVGNKLQGKIIVIVSTTSNKHSRNELAWRNLLIARAAKDNGAQQVVLIEPDLFFSAQDRGPRLEHGDVDFPRSDADYKKFDGQPFSSRLYSQALVLAGVDTVITVHNHSSSVRKLFSMTMPQGFLNMNPAEVFADYILNSDVAPGLHSGEGLLICAPDKGACGFAAQVHQQLGSPAAKLLFFAKQRQGERKVSIGIDPASPTQLGDIAGKDVIIFDDMVRTGTTVKQCCSQLKEAGALRVVFCVTHFYSSSEGRENLNTPELDEIITTNTIPSVLNRDMQGRLRRKMTVLKIGRWVSTQTLEYFELDAKHLTGPLYAVDMSSKNPRWNPLTLQAVGHLSQNY